jgi:hypothetical protein
LSRGINTKPATTVVIIIIITIFQVSLRGKTNTPSIQEPLVVYKDDTGDAHDAMASCSSSEESEAEEGSDEGMSQASKRLLPVSAAAARMTYFCRMTKAILMLQTATAAKMMAKTVIRMGMMTTTTTMTNRFLYAVALTRVKTRSITSASSTSHYLFMCEIDRMVVGGGGGGGGFGVNCQLPIKKNGGG